MNIFIIQKPPGLLISDYKTSRPGGFINLHVPVNGHATSE